MGNKVDYDKLAESYHACTLGSGAGPVHAIMSGDMILDMQPRLKDRVERGVYYELIKRHDGTVSLTELP